MTIIRKPNRVTQTSYIKFYAYKNDRNAGFSFPCNKEGVVDLSTLNKDALVNYNACVEGKYDMRDPEIVDVSNKYIEPAIGKCTCGKEIELGDPMNNSCSCDRNYNSSGQEVLPIHQQFGDDGYNECGETHADVYGPISRE